MESIKQNKSFLRFFHPRFLTDKVLEKARSKYALLWLAFFCFIEGFIFPIPPEVMLIPIIVAKRSRAWIAALIATVFTSLGGLVGWLIGYGFYATIGEKLVELLNIQSYVIQGITLFNDYGAEIIVIGALTPVPYKAIAIASGLASVNVGVFFAYSLLGRAIRFFIEATLLYAFHKLLVKFIEKYLGMLMLFCVAVVILGFWLIGYVR